MVEWGADRRDPFTVVLTSTQVRHWVAYPMAALGAVTAFLSLVLDWQVVEQDPQAGGFGGEDPIVVGIGSVAVWGTGWTVGVLALTLCALVALFGEASARRQARRVGMPLAGVLVGFLVAATVNLERRSPAVQFFLPDSVTFSVQEGVYLAFAAVVLLGAALWTARSAGGGSEPGSWRQWRPRLRPRRAAASADSGSSGGEPVGLTVAPAEPFPTEGRR